MSTLTLVGGRIVDPSSGRDATANIVIDGDTVVHVGRDQAGERIDVDGCVVTPGLVDVHVHLRQPGGEASETVASGTAAAAMGGYTAVCTMANTSPVTDRVEIVEQVRELARQAGHCDVFPSAAITRGLAGEELVDLEALAAAGVRSFSDDGMPVTSSRVMRDALRRAAALGCVVANHAEDHDLTAGAQANEGHVAAELGLPGWPHEAEEVMVARDLLLAAGAGARVHVPHVSTAAAVDVVRFAKQRGIRVTAEATPHHFTLTDELVRSGDPSFKVNPPLRTAADVAAVRAGLADGTLDVIATDHAPHASELKAEGWNQAPCGMLGLETALAVTHTELVVKGVMPLASAVQALTSGPARAFGVPGHGGPIAAGTPANLAVFDLTHRWTVAPDLSQSRSRNTPFAGFHLVGATVHTLLRGRFTVRDGHLCGRDASRT